MEFTPNEIARLVLGYLKAEKCNDAYNNFLNCSQHLKNYTNKKYVITRVNGMSLVDYLNEYAALTTIVQERLENSTYYEETHSYKNLIRQLLYLLNERSSSRESTPVSPILHENKRARTDSYEAESFDLNATSACSLPGNIDTPDSHFVVSKRKTKSLSKSNKNDENEDTTQINVDIPLEVLNFTLKNHELHEKLAENINTVINKPEIITNKSKIFEDNTIVGVTQELNNVIKTIVQKTEADPIFDRLIDEIIGATNVNSTEPTDDTTPTASTFTPIEEKTKSNSTCIKCLQDIKKQEAVHNGSTIVPNTSTTALNISTTTHNTSTIAHNTSTTAQQHPSVTEPILIQTPQVQSAINTCAGEVILYDGSMDNFIKTNSSTRTITSTQSVVNSNNLLMVQPYNNSFTNNLVTNTVQLDTTKPCYILNSHSYVSGTSNPVISEQDILNMPTVIVCDETQKNIPPPPFIVTPYGNQIKNETSNYLTLYQSYDNKSMQQPVKIAPKSTKKIIKKKTKEIDCSIKTKETDFSIKTNENEENKPKTDENLKILNLITPDLKEQNTNNKKTTPHSASHVRALDFTTPTKLFSQLNEDTSLKNDEIDKNEGQSKVAKNLFSEKTPEGSEKLKLKKSYGSSWDSDLRALVNQTDVIKPSSTIALKKPLRRSSTRLKKKKIQTEQEKTIEEEANNDIMDDSSNNSTKTREDKSGEETNNENELDSENEKIKPEPPNELPLLINCNGEARYKKKCNIGSAVKKDISITKVKEVKVLNLIDDTLNNKLILSPSKLNASKRSIVETEIPIEIEAKYIEKQLITPEMVKETIVQPIATAKRNINEILETPIKNYNEPKTPGFLSPLNTADTPFTRVLKEHLNGIDLSTIPTPKFPITPNFPLTPGGTLTPYPHRPTDYSTSSSYYQPSDTEQNKSLEKMIKEQCDEIETAAKRKICILSEIQIPPPDTVEETTEKTTEKTVEKIIEKTTEKTTEKKEDASLNKTIEKLKLFSKNVIGRKNLSLMEPDDSSSDSNSSDDSSDDNSSSSDSWIESPESKTTVKTPPVENTPIRYPLRSRQRNSVTNTDQSELKSENSSTVINEIINTTNVKNTYKNESISRKESILREMEKKRERVLEKMKNIESQQTNKNKQVENKKETKRKLPVKNTPSRVKNKKKTSLKSSSNKRKTMEIFKEETKALDAISIYPIDNFVLHLSSDDEHLEPLEMVETEMLGSSCSLPAQENNDDHLYDISLQSFKKALECAKNKTENDLPSTTENTSSVSKNSEETTSKVDEKNLDTSLEIEDLMIRELKERGIHLIPTKSVKNKENTDKTKMKNNETKTATPSSKQPSSYSPRRNTKSSKSNPSPKQKETNKKSKLKEMLESKTSKTKDTKTKKINNDKRINIQKNDAKTVIKNESIETSSKTDDNSENKTNEDEIVFDWKIYEEETIKMIHDENEKSTKTIDDYNFDLLKKKVTANVYIEELDVNMEKLMTITPLDYLLDLPSKENNSESKKKCKTEKTDEKLKRPSSILYKHLVKGTVNEKSKPSFCNSIESPKNQVLNNCFSKESQNLKQSRERSGSLSNLDKSNANKKSKKCVSDKNNSLPNDGDEKKLKNVTVNNEQSENKEIVGDSVQDSCFDDDLMNYAIVGSERVENDTPPPSDKSTKKRKASIDGSEVSEKKVKTDECQELLKKIGVDLLLTKLHGEK